jgi:protein-S-isoprenylcysteine O-methyltransferase Ste14
MFRQRHVSAAFLAAGWALPASVLATLVERPLAPHATLTLLLSCTLFFGLIPALTCSSLPLTLLFPPALALDLILPRALLGPISTLQLVRQFALFAFIFIPGQLFARWTITQRHLTARAILHPIFHAGLLLGVLPAFLAALGLGTWTEPLYRAPWLNKIYAQLLLIPAILLISAVQEFALRGYGTPMPGDAPRRLVTTGVYAYVANPMQIGKLTMLTAWGLFWGNRWLLLVAFFGLLYSLLIARPREDRAMAARFSSDWHNYRRHVRRWFPRWRPYHTSRLANPTSQPARLYLDLSCDPCSQLAEWLRRHRPAGLEILPLNESDPAGARVTYDPADGSPLEFGISALARALEHINLAFAFFAWMVRLPVIASLAQAVAAALDPRTTACPIRPTFGAAHHPSILHPTANRASPAGATRISRSASALGTGGNRIPSPVGTTKSATRESIFQDMGKPRKFPGTNHTDSARPSQGQPTLDC